jgi:hypothetical protein
MPVLAPTLTKLEVTFTNQPARRPDGHNLWIAINVNLTKLTALFHCQPPDHVGAHSGRMVTYRADHDSVLRFTDRVFKYDHVQLIAQKETVLSVGNDTNNIQADYEIWSGTGNGMDVLPLSESETNPDIVVP